MIQINLSKKDPRPQPRRRLRRAMIGLAALAGGTITIVASLALAEAFGPLGNGMHRLSSDLMCIERPTPFLCGAHATPESLADDMIQAATSLRDNASSLVPPGADPQAFQDALGNLVTKLGDLKSAIQSGDPQKKADAIAAVKKVRDDAHAQFVQQPTGPRVGH